jgi:hypothetical protein
MGSVGSPAEVICALGPRHGILGEKAAQPQAECAHLPRHVCHAPVQFRHVGAALQQLGGPAGGGGGQGRGGQGKRRLENGGGDGGWHRHDGSVSDNSCAGIFKQSMEARDRVGIGLLYRPAT